jgi:copper oxidase (laccase) domain-containing protein
MNIFSHPHISTNFHQKQAIEACGFSERDLETKCQKIPSLLLDSKRPFALQNQIHSCDCSYISKQSDLDNQSDAQRTDQNDFPLGVTFADCIPVLFYGKFQRNLPSSKLQNNLLYATEPKLII